MQLARTIAKADPFQLRMSKRAINQTQDVSGLSVAARAGLSEWTSFRWSFADRQAARGDASALTVDHGGTVKKLAPVAHANSAPVMRLSEMASRLQQSSGLRSSKL